MSLMQQSIQNMEQMSAHFNRVISAVAAHQYDPRAILIANIGKDSKLKLPDEVFDNNLLSKIDNTSPLDGPFTLFLAVCTF